MPVLLTLLLIAAPAPAPAAAQHKLTRPRVVRIVTGRLVPPPKPRAPDPDLVERVVADAARQVRGCYRAPRVASEARQIVTRLAVRYTADGKLAAAPVVIAQEGVTEANSPYARRMAEAAATAVIRCAPVRLPPPLHATVWRELELTFRPVRRV